MLPNFVCLGSPRSGTTWLHSALSRHPAVFTPEKKEHDFFCDKRLVAEPTLGRSHYEKQFAGAADGSYKIVAECTPCYLAYAEEAAPCMQRLLPEAKLLCILRDPVDMAISYYGLFLSFLVGTIDPRTFQFWKFLRFNHIESVCMQGRALQSFLRLFPRERLKICFYEDLRSDPVAFFQDICEYLGIEHVEGEHAKSRVNTNGLARSVALSWFLKRLHTRFGMSWAHQLDETWNRIPFYVYCKKHHMLPLLPTYYEWFQHAFADDVSQIEALTGRDLSHWLCPDGDV